jgi:protein-S-isoprenylcysteine O-methyltransferase Ste14
MKNGMFDLGLIALAWLLYGLLHSWLASQTCKQGLARHWPAALPLYRIGFNVVATLLLLPPLWLTLAQGGEALWHWPAWISWPAAGLAVAGLVWSLRDYDGGEFLGINQWRRHACETEDREALTLSALHRHVRHPWYALGLLLLWTRDLNAAWLVTAAVVTLYVWLGSRLEESKLIALHGDAYRRYRERVPALFPWPGRTLSRDEAGELEELARQSGRKD